eukprot:8468-Pelagococcus_subviridis.AAC.3
MPSKRMSAARPRLGPGAPPCAFGGLPPPPPFLRSTPGAIVFTSASSWRVQPRRDAREHAHERVQRGASIRGEAVEEQPRDVQPAAIVLDLHRGCERLVELAGQEAVVELAQELEDQRGEDARRDASRARVLRARVQDLLARVLSRVRHRVRAAVGVPPRLAGEEQRVADAQPFVVAEHVQKHRARRVQRAQARAVRVPERRQPRRGAVRKRARDASRWASSSSSREAAAGAGRGRGRRRRRAAAFHGRRVRARGTVHRSPMRAPGAARERACDGDTEIPNGWLPRPRPRPSASKNLYPRSVDSTPPRHRTDTVPLQKASGPRSLRNRRRTT